MTVRNVRKKEDMSFFQKKEKERSKEDIVHFCNIVTVFGHKMTE